MFKLLSFTAVFLLISCHNASNTGVSTDAANNAKGEAGVATPGIAVSDATFVECVAGGKVYTVYIDSNSSGSRDADERIVSSQIVCGGVAGAGGAAGADGLDGASGADGTNGVDGNNGLSMVFQTVVATVNQCVAGGVTLLMALDKDRSASLTVADENLQSVTICNGTNGANGTDGANGIDGIDGANGAGGQNGAAAPITGFTPVDYIAACGNTVSYKEILLRLHNGQVLGSFSNSTNGDMTRLAFLPDGVFMNTDNSGCVFSLSTSSDGSTRSVSWNNQVQSSWAVLP